MLPKIKNSYQKISLMEPFVLESGDWSRSDWAALCKLCNLPAEITERIVLHANVLECFQNLEKSDEDAERTYIVTELCPHCENEIEMRWNTDILGFKAFCPVCGKRLMLCDECRHAETSNHCDYDSERDCCRRNPALETMPEAPSHDLQVDTPLGAIIIRAATDPVHPGVYIDLRRADTDQDMPLALVEFSADDADRPNGEKNLITRIWGDGTLEDYTMRVVHQNVETYFATEKVRQEV